MTTDNPLLATTGLPRFSAIRPEHVEPAVDAVLADYRARTDALLASDATRDFANVVLLGEDLEDRLNRVWAPVSHLHGVADSEELRKAYSAAQEKIVEHASELGQNRELYAAVKAVADRAEAITLPRAARTLIEHELRDFRLSGVALEEPARSRFREIANELAKLATEFEEAVLDATDAWSAPIAQESDLAGIPESGRAVLRAYAQEKNADGWLVTLKQPSVQAVLTYADDRSLRERVYRAHQTRASDQGPNAGEFDNTARIDKILALRHEAAQLLGFHDAAEESLATKMAPSPDAVFAFLRDLAARAKPVAERELAELRAFAADELGITELQPWDIGYAAEKLREKKYALNEEELKPYFALDPVIAGLFAITQRVFGVSLKQREGVDVWHPDVRYYDLADANGAVFAGAYVDLYARGGKRGGAWMDVCVNRFVRDGSGHENGTQLPVAFLTCNFAPPTAQTPSLLTHDDVLTLFHEFGHGLHHLLTEVDYPGVAGISGVEWDAVELPSQFMENFGWQREALDLFARHWQSGERLPDELFARMQAARHFHAGLFLVRQLEFALFDFRLHREFDPARGARALEILNEVRDEVAVLHPPAWQRFPHAFTHIFAGGYGAGYYSYLWAEVLSADAFGRFEETGVFDRLTGEAYRKAILAVGGSRPALESFVEFRGREPQPDALLRSYGLAA
ncbi:M3 family metallopeptidase [Dokdonella soli]|uniref:oligopeptidase A n=1 Tax=Dokdonella soli TaxID=529810 RepID=A0ABP3TQN0_9GAMM